MSEQNNKSLYKKQQAAKPKIEDIANEVINGDNLKNLLDFIEFLKNNKMSPRWASVNSWKVMHKNKSVCYVNLNDRDGSWMIRHSQFTREKWFIDYEKYITDAELKGFILEHINGPLCPGRDCWGSKNKMTILGKDFDAVCTCWPLTVKNPDGSVLECSKKFILAIKTIIVDFTTANK